VRSCEQPTCEEEQVKAVAGPRNRYSRTNAQVGTAPAAFFERQVASAAPCGTSRISSTMLGRASAAPGLLRIYAFTAVVDLAPRELGDRTSR
jgi:hypothetical protein